MEKKDEFKVEVLNYQKKEPKKFPAFDSRKSTETIITNQKVKADCNSIAFKNIGDVDCEILGIPLKVDDPMLSFNSYPGGTDKTVYPIVFSQQGNRKVIVIREHLEYKP